MKIKCELNCYEVNGEKTKVVDSFKLKIHSHWNWNDRVVVETPEGQTYTVLFVELSKAIENCINV